MRRVQDPAEAQQEGSDPADMQHGFTAVWTLMLRITAVLTWIYALYLDNVVPAIVASAGAKPLNPAAFPF